MDKTMVSHKGSKGKSQRLQKKIY